MAASIAGVFWRAVSLIRECRRGGFVARLGRARFPDKTRAPRSAARTPRRRGTTPTIDDYYAKYSRSTAERLYEHDNATRRTFDEAARHAEALFAAHDMSPARD